MEIDSKYIQSDLNRSNQLFIEYYHISDKGGLHINSYTYIGNHEANY